MNGGTGNIPRNVKKQVTDDSWKNETSIPKMDDRQAANKARIVHGLCAANKVHTEITT